MQFLYNTVSGLMSHSEQGSATMNKGETLLSVWASLSLLNCSQIFTKHTQMKGLFTSVFRFSHSSITTNNKTKNMHFYKNQRPNDCFLT